MQWRTLLRVLADFHHPALWKSLKLTLVDRLGYELLRPVGMEWYEQGYWQHEKFWAQDRFAKMFLTDRLDLTPAEGQVTLEQARDIKPEIVVATVPGNVLGFRDFADEVGARLVQQIGNNEHFVPWADIDIALDSTNHAHPAWFDGYIRYDQEIDPRYFRRVDSPCGPVSSFLSVWHRDQDGLDYFGRVAEAVGVEHFRLYGEHGQPLQGDEEVIPAMQDSAIVWNTKRIGDGWGHVLHSAMAGGKPIISVNSFYDGMRGSLMLKDNSGVLDISGMDFNDVVKWIKETRCDDERIKAMGDANSTRFNSIVDYERDAAKIKEAFER